jgi:hypothetical protein
MARFIDLRLELSHVTPQVWRVLRVPADLRLDDLHYAIQAVMGWNDFHPHLFEVGDAEYGPAPDDAGDDEDDDDSFKERSAWAGEDRELTIRQALTQSANGVTYVYNFAEDWRVRMTAEAEGETDQAVEVVCLAGEQRGPQHESRGLDPFGVDEANARLRKATRPRATAERPAGPRASRDQQLLAELTLAVLMLGSRPTRHGTREAWKHFRSEVLDSLQEAGLVDDDPVRKSVTLTAAGVAHAERLLQRLRKL